MFTLVATRWRPGRNAATGLSLVLHGLALTAMLYVAHTRPVRVFTLPGSPNGTHVSLVYLPGRAPAPVLTSKARRKPQAAAAVQLARAVAPAPDSALALQAPPRPHLTLTAPALASTAQTVPAPAPDATTGSDSYGSGDIQIAFTTYSPSPKPDLSSLPRGMQGDVVVDVTIDPTGKVADLAVLRTLGYGVESSVLSTVRTWTFRPATKDGVPVASVQELHFHYGPA